MSISYLIDVPDDPMERGDIIKKIIKLIDTNVPSASKYFITSLRFSFVSALYTANGRYIGHSVNAKKRNIYPIAKLIVPGLSLSHWMPSTSCCTENKSGVIASGNSFLFLTFMIAAMPAAAVTPLVMKLA